MAPLTLKTGLALTARIAAAALALVLTGGAAIVAEAAGATDRALRHAHAAVNTHEGAMLSEELAGAAAILQNSWARPLAWHAGALEALSWISTQRGLAAQTEAAPVATRYFQESADLAVQGLARAPVQPAAWARLAGLADAGAQQARCGVRACLNHSWRAARMAQAETACPRLQIAYEHGFLRRDDVRIQWVARADYWGETIRRCVAFMRPADMFRALMIYEQDRAAREARRQFSN
ncbi:MAG: hypothetical protein GC206_04465 [Alphaproteobacteria bacterium]|nr:hypothetical protein [Alphaproteobacteria bacterium]